MDNHLLNLLNSSSIIKKNTRLFLIWAVDKEGTPCLLPEEDIFCWAWMQLKPVSNKYSKPAVRENLIVNGIVADIIDFEADDVYDVVLIVRVLLILQSNKIRKSVLEKYSSAVCNDGYYLIADTPKNQILICNIFKSLKQDLEFIKNKKGFLFAHKIKR